MSWWRGFDSEFAERFTQVVVDGAGADEELSADLLVRGTIRREAGDLGFLGVHANRSSHCSEIVGAPGLQPRPLGDWAPVGAVGIGLGGVAPPSLRPPGGRVLPRFLPPVDGPVKQPRVAWGHHLDAASALDPLADELDLARSEIDVLHGSHKGTVRLGINETVERCLGPLATTVADMERPTRLRETLSEIARRSPSRLKQLGVTPSPFFLTRI